MSQMRHFFALKEDLLPMLAAAEGKIAVTYVSGKTVREPRHATYDRGADIPDLGRSQFASAGFTTYFVFPRGAPVTSHRVDASDGNAWFHMNQMMNPDTIEFSPGGLWRDDVLLHGRVATAYRSKTTDDLMKAYRWAIQKHFVRVRAFWVGPAAMELLRRGGRLTGAEQSPREYDLALE